MSFISADQQLKPRTARSAASTGIPPHDPAAQARPGNSPKTTVPAACDDRYSPDNNTGAGQATAQDDRRGGRNRSTMPNIGSS